MILLLLIVVELMSFGIIPNPIPSEPYQNPQVSARPEIPGTRSKGEYPSAKSENQVVNPSIRPNPTVPAPTCGLLHVFVLNVSQADAIVIFTPKNKTILIDTGSGSYKDSADHLISFLKARGITRVDSLILTHNHEDHIGGVEMVVGALGAGGIGTIYRTQGCDNLSSKSERYIGSFSKLHGSETVSAGREPSIRDISIDDCLRVTRLMNAGCIGDGENDNSIVTRIGYGKTTFLFTGDCSTACEKALMQSGENLSADFLKIAHHGSASSSSGAFLDAVDARFYAISSDRNKSVSLGYFHPRQTVLGAIYTRDTEGPASTGTGLWRTDLEGDIEAISDGRAVSVSSSGPVADECKLFSGYSSSHATSYGPIPALAGRCG